MERKYLEMTNHNFKPWYYVKFNTLTLAMHAIGIFTSELFFSYDYIADQLTYSGSYFNWEFLYMLDSRWNDSWDHSHVSNPTSFIQRWNQQPSRSFNRRHTHSYADSVICNPCNWFSSPLSTGISLEFNCNIRTLSYIYVQGAITKRMTAIEELAGMDVLCSDKTGTLTLNRLTVDRNLIEVSKGFFVCSQVIHDVSKMIWLLMITHFCLNYQVSTEYMT